MSIKAKLRRLETESGPRVEAWSRRQADCLLAAITTEERAALGAIFWDRTANPDHDMALAYELARVNIAQVREIVAAIAERIRESGGDAWLPWEHESCET